MLTPVVRVLATVVTSDPVDSHRAWEQDITDTQGAAVNLPMIADPDGWRADKPYLRWVPQPAD